MKTLNQNRRFVFSFLLMILMSAGSFAQGTYFTRSGYVKFFSTTPMEDILAQNYKVTSVLDASTGKLEFAVLIKGFEFEKALMQEHFNENYMESGKYSKSTFKGAINDFDKLDINSIGENNVTVTGDLTIHGVTKKVTIAGTVENKDGKLNLSSVFKVKPEDYNIKIPGAVKSKIAKELDVTVLMSLSKM